MASEDMMYASIFTILLGFITFTLAIINKINVYFELVSTYFVLFLFAGIIMSFSGIVMGVIYNFENRQPFYEPIQKKPVKMKRFIPYLVIGIILTLVGFTSIYYFQVTSRIYYIMSMAVSITGILLLLNGLFYFMKEVILVKKTPGHF